MQEPAILGSKEEDQSVNKAQELLEVSLTRQGAIGKGPSQSAIRGVVYEPLTEFEQSCLDSLAQLVACSHPIGAPPLAPPLQRTVRNRCICLAEPTLMDEKLERGEIRKQTFGKDLGKIRFDPGRSR
jgi:hypothetical protein